MIDLQHERIKALAVDLQVDALPNLYGGIAQHSARSSNTSYADFLKLELDLIRSLRTEVDFMRV